MNMVMSIIITIIMIWKQLILKGKFYIRNLLVQIIF